MTPDNELIPRFEIPASDLQRAIRFYKTVLEFPIEIKRINDQFYGVFSIPGIGIRGVIREDKFVGERNGPILFFRIKFDISSALDRVEKCGGKIIQEKTLLRNSTGGQSVIPHNLIDYKIGYYATFIDTEGNKMSLYANN